MSCAFRLAANARKYIGKEHSYSTYKSLVFDMYGKLQKDKSDVHD